MFKALNGAAAVPVKNILCAGNFGLLFHTLEENWRKAGGRSWLCHDEIVQVSLFSPHSLLNIHLVVVTINILANPQQSGGMRPLVARSVLSLPDVQEDCVERRPYKRRRTNSDCLHNKICFKRISHFFVLSPNILAHLILIHQLWLSSFFESEGSGLP